MTVSNNKKNAKILELKLGFKRAFEYLIYIRDKCDEYHPPTLRTIIKELQVTKDKAYHYTRLFVNYGLCNKTNHKIFKITPLGKNWLHHTGLIFLDKKTRAHVKSLSKHKNLDKPPLPDGQVHTLIETLTTHIESFLQDVLEDPILPPNLKIKFAGFCYQVLPQANKE